MRVNRIAPALLQLLMRTAASPSPFSGFTFKKSKFFTPAKKKKSLYEEWNLESIGIAEEAFTTALKGYQLLKSTNQLLQSNHLTIIDYNQPSTQKRLYVLDMTTGKLIFHSLVAHGQGSGIIYASDFSNVPESYKSSLGFYVTGKVYRGKNGYSLKLHGLEKDINDKALFRDIVIHGAKYVSQDFINQHGYVGRSQGCPALPIGLNNQIIDQIKDGSCVFIYHSNKKYLAQSTVLNQ